MALTVKILGGGTLTTATASYYAAGGATKGTLVKSIFLANSTTATASASVAIHPSNGATGFSILKSYLVPPHSTYAVPGEFTVSGTDEIKAKGGTGSAIDISIFGVERDQ